MMEILLGGLGLGLVLALLVRDYRRIEARKREEAGALFGLLEPLMTDVRLKPVDQAGCQSIEGRLGGQFVQIRAVADTLSLRKLPSLWLMITLPGDTGLSATLDMMMRPAGQSSFSNFDLLPDTLARPAGFPEEAVLKSDDAALAPDPGHFRPLLRPFTLGIGKELLATPKGVRMVVQLAEADRARYGVLRPAQFSTEPLRPEWVLPLVDLLADLKDRLRETADRDTETERMTVHG